MSAESPTQPSTLDDAETRYRALFETMGPAVLLMRGPACIDCNPATLRLFGLERREEFLGKTPLDFAPEVQPTGERSADLVQRNLIEAMRRGTQTFEWQSIRKGGERFIMEVRFTPCGPPEGQLFLCIAVDISERRHAEEALRQSEARFRTIVERSTQGLVVADAETRQLRYGNPEIRRQLGYSADELLALTIDDLHPPEARARAAAAFASQSAGTPVDLDLTLARRDGTTLEMNVRGAQVELDGRPCVVGLFTDLTEHRLIESERLRTQRLDALGTLAGGIAHDFNNLLHAVVGLVSAAKLAPTLAQARAELDESEQVLKMAGRLTTQLLTFSRGGAPMKKVIALGPVIERAARFALSGSAVAARFELAGDLWAAEVDEGQLEQVIQNIVLNAAQATPSGGTLSVSARNEPLADQGPLPAGAGPFVAIAVRDEGAGIPPALRERIFEPYFTTKPRGTGLGLATAYSVVRSHGGVIEVASPAGAGATFTVRLPASRSPVPAPASSTPPARARPARVLLMDDDEMIRKVTAKVIRSLGHEVDVTSDGAEALARYRAAQLAARPYDLVILDLTVPGGMGGVETLVRLRALAPDVKAIVSSGYSHDAALGEHRAHGFCAALRKPYDRQLLEQTLSDQLGHLGAPAPD